MREIVNEDIFDPEHMDQVIAVVWWLTYLLGGRVVFPIDEEFWLNNFPKNTKLVVRVENDQPMLIATYED